MNLCTDQLVVRLAEPGHIAAVTKYMEDPENTTLLKEARPYKKIRGTAEEVLALKPDLVLAGRFTSPMTVRLLERLGLRVEVLEVPRNYDEIRSLIRKTSAMLGEEARGESMISEMENRLQTLPKPRLKHKLLFYGVGGDTSGIGTFEDAIIQTVGAENLAAEIGIQGHGLIPLEKVAAGKPDLLIFSDESLRRGSMRRQVFAHPVIQRFVDSGQSMRLPSKLIVCGSLDTLDAAEKIASQIQGMEAKTR